MKRLWMKRCFATHRPLKIAPAVVGHNEPSSYAPKKVIHTCRADSWVKNRNRYRLRNIWMSILSRTFRGETFWQNDSSISMCNRCDTTIWISKSKCAPNNENLELNRIEKFNDPQTTFFFEYLKDNFIYPNSESCLAKYLFPIGINF